jgi:hypothetical protein
LCPPRRTQKIERDSGTGRLEKNNISASKKIDPTSFENMSGFLSIIFKIIVPVEIF